MMEWEERELVAEEEEEEDSNPGCGAGLEGGLRLGTPTCVIVLASTAGGTTMQGVLHHQQPFRTSPPVAMGEAD